MRKKVLTFASIVLVTITVGSSAAPAATTPNNEEIRTARAEAGNALPPVPAPVPPKPGTSIDELRDCAALVLVGGMLIGLAAAVRRTV